jgi:hypothetical protein
MAAPSPAQSRFHQWPKQVVILKKSTGENFDVNDRTMR